MPVFPNLKADIVATDSPLFTLHDLAARVSERARASGEASYTRKLLDKGVAHCAKKLGEEAVETAIAAVSEDRERLIAEAADLLYHLLVVLEARGVKLAEIEAVLATRTGKSGLEREGVAPLATEPEPQWTSAPRPSSHPTASSRAPNGRPCATTRR